MSKQDYGRLLAGDVGVLNKHDYMMKILNKARGEAERKLTGHLSVHIEDVAADAFDKFVQKASLPGALEGWPQSAWLSTLASDVRDIYVELIRKLQAGRRGGVEDYKVKDGDTLESIAVEVEVEPDHIKNCHHNNKIKWTHKVEEGDTLESIAEANGLPPDDITTCFGNENITWSQLTEGQKINLPLRQGQVIKIPKLKSPQSMNEEDDEGRVIIEPSTETLGPTRTRWAAHVQSGPREELEENELWETISRVQPVCFYLFQFLYVHRYPLQSDSEDDVERMIGFSKKINENTHMDVKGWDAVKRFFKIKPTKDIKDQTEECLKRFKGLLSTYGYGR